MWMLCLSVCSLFRVLAGASLSFGIPVLHDSDIGVKMKMMSTMESADVQSFSADGRGRGKCAWMPAGAQIGCLVDL